MGVVELHAGNLVLSPDTTITCPKCATEFGLEQGFAKKALERLVEASSGAIATLRQAERAQVEKLAEQLAAEKARVAQAESESFKRLLQEQAQAHGKALTEVRALAENSIAPRIDEMQRALAAREAEVQTLRSREEALTEREQSLESRVSSQAQARAAELIAAERQAFTAQLAEKTSQVAALREEQLALRRQREQLEDEKAALALEVQRQVDSLVKHREAIVRAQEQERAHLEKAELQKKLDDAGEQLEAARRRMEQGSQQLQGEVLELQIEDAVRRAFPLDAIEEVRKGQRGGDLLQHVVTRTGQAAGTILWETKRAKEWSAQWIPKLKADMGECNAVVGILVTMPGALPKEWPGSAYFALHDGIWVTHASCAVGVAEILRIGLLDLHRQRAVSAGKGEKMEALYDYLTSAQFANKLRAVFDTFRKMKEELDSEKNVTLQRWARREKQLEIGRNQLLGVGGEIQGLAQNPLPSLDLDGAPPELPDP